VGNTEPARGAPHNLDEALAMFLGTGFKCPQASTYVAMNVGAPCSVARVVVSRTRCGSRWWYCDKKMSLLESRC
jgi:hypothetical protein